MAEVTFGIVKRILGQLVSRCGKGKGIRQTTIKLDTKLIMPRQAKCLKTNHC